MEASSISITRSVAKSVAGVAWMLSLMASAVVGQEEPLTRTDWPDFLRQHHMTFDELPRSWQEAPHFGNAMVGSML